MACACGSGFMADSLASAENPPSSFFLVHPRNTYHGKPKKEALEDDNYPFQRGDFLVPCSFSGGSIWMFPKIVGFPPKSSIKK